MPSSLTQGKSGTTTGGARPIQFFCHIDIHSACVRLIALNGWIVLLLITSSTNGYDGSMMNGLQSLPQWQSAFNYPTGGKLGLLNAIQVIISLFFEYEYHTDIALEHRRSCWIPIRTLRLRYPRTSTGRPSGCRHHDYRHCDPRSCSVC